MSDKIPNPNINPAEAVGQQPIAPESPKTESRWEKIKGVLSNKEVQKQAGKTMIGSAASVIGLKSIYDVPTYFRQRFAVRGGFGMGNGLEDSIEDVMAASQKTHEEIIYGEREMEKDENGEPIDSGITSTRKAIEDLNKRLAMTREGSEKHSEQRKLIAKMLWENREIKKMADESRHGEITRILDDYTTTKVTGMQAARESLNSFCVASGAFALRGAAYGIMDGVERYQRLSKEARKKGGDVSIFKDVIIGGIQETLKEAAGKSEEKGAVRKTFKGIAAWGKIARYSGMAATVKWHPEAMENNFDKALDALEGKISLGDISENFQANLERVSGAYSGLWKKIFGGEEVVPKPGPGSILEPKGSILKPKGITPEELGKDSASGARRIGQEGADKPESILKAKSEQEEIYSVLKPRPAEELKTPLEYDADYQKAKAVEEANIAYDARMAAEEAMPKFMAEKVEIKSGDSIWTVAKKYFAGNEEFNKLGGEDADKAEALKTYNIDKVKRIILADPKKFGMPEGGDINKLSAKQLGEIKWEDAFNAAFKEKTLETDLSAKQIENIVSNNRSLREFFSEHPKAPRTQDNYEAILRGKGLTGEEAAILEKETVVLPEGEGVAAPETETTETPILGEEELKAEAAARTQARAEEIYKYKWGPFKGSQIEEWDVIREKAAQDIMNGKFGESINELDAVEMNNREEIQAYINEAKNVIGDPEANESVKSYCERYESFVVNEAFKTETEIARLGLDKKIDDISYIPSAERVKIFTDYRNIIKGLESPADKAYMIKVLHNPKDSEALSKIIGGVNNNVFEGRPRAILDNKGNLIVSFDVKDNAVDTSLIITKNGKIAVDGYMKNNWPSGVNIDNPTRDLNKQSLNEAMKFLNKGEFWNELKGKISDNDIREILPQPESAKTDLVAEEPVASEAFTTPAAEAGKDVIVEPMGGDKEPDIIVEPMEKVHGQMADFREHALRDGNMSKLIDSMKIKNSGLAGSRAENIINKIMDEKHMPYMRGEVSKGEYGKYIDGLNKKYGNAFDKEAILNLKDKTE